MTVFQILVAIVEYKNRKIEIYQKVIKFIKEKNLKLILKKYNKIEKM